MGNDKYIGDEYIVKKNPNMFEIPDNATNGDAMKMLFKVNPILDNQTDIMIVAFPDGFALYVPVEWWNAPYKAEGGEV